MYDSPCSRIGHVFRGGMPFPNDRKGIDFVAINYKRVAEVRFFITKFEILENEFTFYFRMLKVWMDEYKHYLYKREPERYAKTKTGFHIFFIL